MNEFALKTAIKKYVLFYDSLLKKKSFVYTIDVAVFLLISLFFCTLISLIHPGRHVDPDFFQFLNDSTYYLSGKLPPSIQSLPMNPILIGVIGKATTGWITEIEVALMLNAFFSTLTLAMVYILLRRTAGIVYALLSVVFLVTHPIFLRSAVSNNTEVLFSLFVVIFLYLMSLGYKRALFFISAIGILIRYESALFFPALLLTTYLSGEKLKKLLINAIVFIVPGITILLILLLQNNSETVVGTPFFQEVIERREDLPELRFFTNLGNAFVGKLGIVYSSISYMSYLVSTFCFSTLFFGLYRAMKSKKTALNRFHGVYITSILFVFQYLIFHSLFPAYLDRYMVPVIVTLSYSFAYTLKMFSHIYVKVGAIFLICFLTLLNIMAIPEFYSFEKTFVNSDFFMARSVQEETDIDSQYLLVTPYPDIQAYYMRGTPNVDLISVVEFKELTGCETVKCAFETISEMRPNSQVLVPYTSTFEWGMEKKYDNSLVKWYEELGLYELGEYIQNDNLCELYSKAYWPFNVSITMFVPCDLNVVTALF